MKTKEVIVVCGPTATGKSDYAIEYAKQHNGAVVSADSRQIYRELPLATGAVLKHQMHGICHYLIGHKTLSDSYSVFEYQKDARDCIETIISSGKTPILCGGTGYYIEAAIYNQVFPPQIEIPAYIEEMQREELVQHIQKKYPLYTTRIDLSHTKRMRRALSLLENNISLPEKNSKLLYTPTWIGIDCEKTLLKQRIEQRVLRRIEEGMIEEIKTLITNHKEKLLSLGLEMKYTTLYLEGSLTFDQYVDILTTKINQFAKRQKTWFKRNKNIHWIQAL